LPEFDVFDQSRGPIALEKITPDTIESLESPENESIVSQNDAGIHRADHDLGAIEKAGFQGEAGSGVSAEEWTFSR
jgi:hypothetical protein